MAYQEYTYGPRRLRGDAVHAIVPQGFLQPFIDVLHEGNVYEFSRFRLMSLVLYAQSPRSRPLKSQPEKIVLLKRHVYLRDLSGHEVKIVLWGNCALRFNGDVIRVLGQTKSIVAIFVGSTIHAYDGIKGLAAGAPCSWYIDDNIVDIKKFHARYWFSVIASDRTGEAEFTLFGSLATQMIGSHIKRVIELNHPTDDPIFIYEAAAGQVRFPPPEVSRMLSCRYRFVVSAFEGSFQKMQPSFMV